jgi:hypothetical protein
LPISFSGKPKDEDVVSLIAAKKYARAIEVLKAQLQRRGANPSLRMQLADVLLLADKKKEAVALLLPLADQYANEGFAAKAVSVLKKVQKIDPGRRDVDSRLARLIEEKQREAVVFPSRTTVIGIEEAPSAGRPAAEAATDGPSLEIGFDVAPISAPIAPGGPVVPVAAPAPPPAPPGAAAATVPAPALPALVAPPPPSPTLAPPPLPATAAPAVVVPAIAAPTPPAEVRFSPVAAPAPPAAAPTPLAVAAAPAIPAAGGEIEDYDLLYSAEGDEDEELVLEAEIVDEAAPAAEPMSAGQFADELMGLVDSVFQEFPGSTPAPAATAPRDGPAQGRQIVVSPLFRDFSVDEMVAVIEGLRLLAFERGDVILKEGQPGTSLYMLTSGRVRAFRKSAQTGRQDVLGDLKEGAFFGEVSILTGQPRMASIVALTRCELLELDRPTLDEITKTHPHVWDVLREFAKERAG